MVSLKTKFEGRPLDRGTQPVLWWLRTLPICSYFRCILTHDVITSGQRQQMIDVL